MIKIKYWTKLFISNLLGIIKFYDLSLYLQKILYKNKFVRAVNYHCTPQDLNKNFELHMEYYSKNFVSVNEDMIIDFLENGIWKYEKPGLIICFDDGLNCNLINTLPILEKYNFIAWFMLPIGFLLEDKNKHEKFIQENSINCFCRKGDRQDRIAMPVDQIKVLKDKGHIISSHTINHIRMSENIDQNVMDSELFKSKSILEEYTLKPVRSFCWVGGEEENYNDNAVKAINRSDYYISFANDAGFMHKKSNHKPFNRINIETHYNLNMCKFYLSGFIDVFYYFKRIRIQNKFKNNL